MVKLKFTIKMGQEKLQQCLKNCVHADMTSLNLHLLIKAGARENCLECNAEDKLLLRIQTAPIAGKANSAIIQLLAQLLKIPRGNITLANGQKSKHKRFRLEGINITELYNKLSALL